MIPIYLEPSATQIALIGRGRLALRRLAWLEAAGARPVVWSDAPSPELETAAGARLQRRLPSAAEIVGFHAIWIADLSVEEARPLALAARAAHALVNVEDVIELCDFHTPAVVHRGRLTLAAGTGGASPAVARAAREKLETAFTEEWSGATEEIANSRTALRKQGADFDTLVSDARKRLHRHGLI
ncbi:MAG: NAD(P)-dependent oxidoreductase [Hyphomonadaceae bacterium]|nr:NAD(P)-dependent oxidoreductase [Hyphomonadaceae bacterium]